MPHFKSHSSVHKVILNQESNGYDNVAFETPRSRKTSTNSNHTVESRIRKKNMLHDSQHFGNFSPHDIIGNGDPKVKKISTTDSVYSKSLNTAPEDENRSCWYNFCLKCRNKQDGKPSWEPKFWPKLCPYPFWPTYRQFSRILSLICIGVLFWCILYAIVGDTAAPPDGMLYQLILLGTCAHLGGWLMGLTTFPPLVGMLFTGILFQNVHIVDFDESFTEITKELGHIALVIILIRAGLDLDPVALQKLKFTVLKLSIIPWLVEAMSVMVLSRFLLNMSWEYAILLGSIIAAVAPAVVVPCLIRLRSKGYGVAKGIPTLIIAVSSIDDATSVAIFGVIKSIMFSDSSLVNNIIFSIISIASGIGFGVLWGIICSFIPERNDPFTTPLRVLLLLAGAMAAVLGSELVGYGGAGPLGCVTAAFVAMACWSKQGWEVDDNPAATVFEIFWLVIQPVIFSATGAKIKFSELDGTVVGISVGILIAGVAIRILFTILIGIGCRLNLKEKVFVAIPWMCKAIVQAALGPIALTIVDYGTKEYIYAEKILTTCVLSIILTAPIGALLTTFLGPHLLTKANLPPLAEVRKRKKSRLSLRDLSIADEEEFSTESANSSQKHINGKSTVELDKDEITV